MNAFSGSLTWTLLLGQLSLVAKPLAALQTGWIVGAGIAVFLLFIPCMWLWWRVRTLGLAVKALAASRDQPISIPGGFGFLPRFGTRTLLVLLTLSAVAFGMFASELNRARRQGQAFETLSHRPFLEASYRSGMLGDSKLAGFFCDWIHPHFGCRLTHLCIEFDGFVEDQTHNQISNTYPKQLAGFSDLEALQIIGAVLRVEDMEAIGSLRQLKQLSLRDCRLPDNALVSIGQLTQLETLDLAGCDLIDDELKKLEPLARLYQLSLERNSLITNQALLSIAKLKKLQMLDLTSTDVSDVGFLKLAELKHLSDLKIADTYVTEAVVDTLISIPSLKSVNLKHCPKLSARNANRIAKQLDEATRLQFDSSEAQYGHQWEFSDNRPTNEDDLLVDLAVAAAGSFDLSSNHGSSRGSLLVRLFWQQRLQ